MRNIPGNDQKGDGRDGGEENSDRYYCNDKGRRRKKEMARL